MAEINGTYLYYQHDRSAGSGETVAFMNGILMTVESWVFQMHYFSKRYNCLFHDFRGQLKSDKPDGPYSMELHARDFKALLDHLGIDKCHVVGTSYGGEAGMVFAADYPERVSSLTVIAGFSNVDALLATQIQTWIDVAVSCPENLFGVATACVFSNSYRTRFSKLLEDRRKWFVNQPPEFIRGFVRLAETVRNLDIRDKLGEIQCPCMIMCGDQDVMIPVKFSRRLAQLIPSSEFVVIPDGPHGIVLEKPNEINTVVNGFIEKHNE